MAKVAGRSPLPAAASLVASVVLFISAMWLPWATVRGSRINHNFRTGQLDYALTVIAVVSFGLAALALLRDRSAIYRLEASIGCLAVVCSLALALTKISQANHAATGFPGGYSQTSYAFGSLLGVAASLLMVLSSVSVLVRCKLAEVQPARRSREAHARASAARKRLDKLP